MSETIILRCDYFHGSGVGHIKRTGILASALKIRGFKPILLIDDTPLEIPVFLDVECEKLYIKEFDELKDADLVVQFATLHHANFVIVDSYRITSKWINRIKENNIKVFLIDDMNIHSCADLSVNYTPINKIDKTILMPNQLRGPKFFITDSKKCQTKENSPKKIIAHVGGNGDYSKARNIFSNLAYISDKESMDVDWICTDPSSVRSLKAIVNLNANDKILFWAKDSSTLWSNYQIVVGPASTSLYEAIIQGALPISFAISNTQSTELKDWLSIGHTLHIPNHEKENSIYINLILKLAISQYRYFIDTLKEFSKDLDGEGVSRVVDAINLYVNKSENGLEITESKYYERGVLKCNIYNAQSFLIARNAKEVREMSTDPNHIITWPEHLRWWINNKIDKYLFLGNSNTPEAYFWVKRWEINNKKYLTAGWFPSTENTPFTSILKILDWQIKYYSNNCAGYIWVATVKNDNKTAIALNLRVGFVVASKETYSVLPILFPGTDNSFKIFELKL